MAYTTRALLGVALLFSAVGMVGCGGGSGGVAPGVGSISGRAFQNSSRASGVVTVAVEGTTLSVATRPDDSFVISNVPAGIRTLVARSSNMAVAIAVSVVRAGNTNVGDLVLRDAGQISGLITSAADRSPIQGALVTVMEAVVANTADTVPHPVRGVRTDANGSYTVAGLPVGSYVANIAASGYATDSLALDVRSGTTATGDAALAPIAPSLHGSMGGTVYAVNEDGTVQPLAGALVRLTQAGSPGADRPLPDYAAQEGGGSVQFYPNEPPTPNPFYTFSDDTGAYKLDGVPVGEYLAIAVRPGMDAATQSVTIRADQMSQVDFKVTVHVWRFGTIAGVVTNSADGKPVPGATAVLQISPSPPPTGGSAAAGGGTSDGSFVGTGGIGGAAIADAQGRFSMKSPAGTFEIAIDAPGFTTYQTSVTVTAGGTTQVQVSLTPSGEQVYVLTGTVYRTAVTGARVVAPGARVWAEYSGPQMRPIAIAVSTKADENGAYMLRLAAGTYRVGATDGALWTMPQDLTIASDRTLDMVLEEAVGL